MGWATVTHPFHPLLGKRFLVLKVRRVAGCEVFSLFDEHNGTIALPREWTDHALPTPFALPPPAAILDASCLLRLQALIEHIKKRIDDAA